MTRNYYDILGIQRNATLEQIKTAYKKLAMEHHPDKGGDEEKFKELSNAYEHLSDTTKRNHYNMFGSTNNQQNSQTPFTRGFHFHTYQPPKQCPDYVHILKLSLKECFTGITKVLKISRKRICTQCNGKGSTDGSQQRCTECRNGIRTIKRQIARGIVQTITVPCYVCNRTGVYIPAEKRCLQCNGCMTIQETKEFSMIIPRGVKTAYTIIMNGEAEQLPNHIAGNLIIKIEIIPDDQFVLKDNDLYLTKTITLAEALLGFSFVITHLNDKILHITSNEIIHPNQHKIIKGEGFYILNTNQRGDLNIEFNIEFPTEITNKEFLPHIISQPINTVKLNEQFTQVELKSI